MQIPIRQASIPVIYKTPSGDLSRTVTLNVSDIVPLATGTNRENIIRNSVEALSGIQRQVMSDLYRLFVLGNFTRYNGESGKATEPALNRQYPNHETLPEFELKSGKFNALGMIVYNLRKHPESYKTGYRILGGILLSLFGEKVFDSPQLEIGDEFSPPEEVSEVETFSEGAVRRILVNSYERDRAARQKCIAHYEAKCWYCHFDFHEAYGEIGKGFIHVHHLRLLSEIGAEYQVDPIQDLRPVCPNCHAIIHKRNPPYTLEEVQGFLQKAKQQ